MFWFRWKTCKPYNLSRHTRTMWKFHVTINLVDDEYCHQANGFSHCDSLLLWLLYKWPTRRAIILFGVSYLVRTFSLVWFDQVLKWIHSRLPYNWKTPISYLFTMCIQYLTAYYAASCYISAFNIFYGICRFLNGFTADLEQCLRQLYGEIEQISARELHLSSQSRYKLKMEFRNIVRLHGDVKL